MWPFKKKKAKINYENINFNIVSEKYIGKMIEFTNILTNIGDTTLDYYRFIFPDIKDIKLYITCLYDDKSNIAPESEVLKAYIDKSIIKTTNEENTYSFIFDNASKYFMSFTHEIINDDQRLGFNNIIHGYTDDGYIDFFIIFGKDIFEPEYIDYIINILKSNYSSLIEKGLTKVVEKEDTKEVEKEEPKKDPDILRYITVKDNEGNEENIKLKYLPKKFEDWEERFKDQLLESEIDEINELYASWYSKK